MAARDAFPGFYAHAGVAEVALMDAMILLHAALIIGVHTPREGLDAAMRRELEAKADEVERHFAEHWQRLRACATFAKLSPGEQLAIKRHLFNLRSDLAD